MDGNRTFLVLLSLLLTAALLVVILPLEECLPCLIRKAVEENRKQKWERENLGHPADAQPDPPIVNSLPEPCLICERREKVSLLVKWRTGCW
jgi:hypothetical protein